MPSALERVRVSESTRRWDEDARLLYVSPTKEDGNIYVPSDLADAWKELDRMLPLEVADDFAYTFRCACRNIVYVHERRHISDRWIDSVDISLGGILSELWLAPKDSRLARVLGEFVDAASESNRVSREEKLDIWMRAILCAYYDYRRTGHRTEMAELASQIQQGTRLLESGYPGRSRVSLVYRKIGSAKSTGGSGAEMPIYRASLFVHEPEDPEGDPPRIIRQYSMQSGNVRFDPQDSTSQTFRLDREAFRNPEWVNRVSPQVPSLAMTPEEYAEAIIEFGDSYLANPEHYRPGGGPNANSAALFPLYQVDSQPIVENSPGVSGANFYSPERWFACEWE